MEKWIEEIEHTIDGATVVMEGDVGSCSRICKVISDAFEGKPLLHRHRSVKKVLERHFAEDLHALSIHTYTNKEWEDATRNS